MSARETARSALAAAAPRLAEARARLAATVGPLAERLGAMPVAQKPKKVAGLLLDAFVAGLEPRIGRFIDRSRRVAVVEAEGIALYEIRDRQVRPLGRLGATALPDDFRAGPLELRLPPERFLQRSLRLPDAGRDYLGPILAHRLERLTPWRPEKVLYGWAVPEPAGPDGTIAVELLATSADAVAPHLAALEAEGLTVAALGSAAEPLDAPLTIDLHRGRDGSGGGDRLRRLTKRVATILFAVLIPAWLVTGWIADSAEAERAESEARLGTLRVKLAARAGGGGSRERALIEAKRPENAMLVLVDRLSAALPDTAVLRELDADAAKVRLVGRSSTDASALIAILEAQAPLKQVRFAAPVIRDAERRDAFDIVASRSEAAR